MSKTIKRPRLIPPVYLVICVAIILVCYVLFPDFNIIEAPYNYLSGAPFLLAGLYFMSASYFSLKKYRTTIQYDKSTSVVKSGVFKISRNPMYLGFVLLLASLALMLGSVLSIVSPVIFLVVADRLFAPYEESKMQQELGQDYSEYKKQVRRWL